MHRQLWLSVSDVYNVVVHVLGCCSSSFINTLKAVNGIRHSFLGPLFDLHVKYFTKTCTHVSSYTTVPVE